MKFWTPFYAVVAGLCVLSTPVLSGTVVSFDPASGQNTNIGLLTPSVATGRWVESGFNVDWVYDNLIDFVDGEEQSANFTTLAIGAYGYSGTGISLDVTRAGGKSFSLETIGLGYTLSNYLGLASFVPYDSEGNLDSENAIAASYHLKFDDLFLEGVKNTGELVQLAISSFGAAAAWESVGVGDPWVAGSGVFALDAAQQALFSNLTTLRITSNSPWTTGLDFLTSLQQAAGYVDPVFVGAPSSCFVRNQLCDVPMVGQFVFLEEYYGDVHAYTSIASLGLKGAAISPVPLSGSLSYLALGLLAFGFYRRNSLKM